MNIRNRGRLPALQLGTALCLLLAPVLAPVLAIAQQSPPGGDHLTLEHYMSWEGVADPQLSPDGEKIIYTRRFMDPVNDRWSSALWVMNADGTRNRFLTEGSSPTWSPDGTRIAYTASGEPGGSQIFVRWMDAEGSTSQITRLEQSPGSIEWSPDGARILFQSFVPADPDPAWRIDLPRAPRGAEWAGSPVIEDRIHFRRDGQGWTPRGHQHLFVVDADAGQPFQVTHGEWDHSSARWMPDGSSVVFQSHRVPDADRRWRESHLYRVDVQSREVTRLTEVRGPKGNPTPSPDGRLIAWSGYEWVEDSYIESSLYVMDADGSGLRELATNLDRSPSGLTWAGDNSGVYFSADDRGTRNLHFAPLDGPSRQVTEGTHMLSVSQVLPNGMAVGTVSTFQDPGSLVRFRVNSPELEVLHRTNRAALAQLELGDVEELWYTSVDDWDIQGWIIKPPDFDPNERYPLILVIHGGPHAMYNVSFNFAWQNHAANGYVVLYTNPRGSSGYGSEFGNAIMRAYPSKDYDDLMAGVDTVVNRGYIDDANMFVYGGSGGGVLTAWIVGHTDRFAAAVSKAPVINWMSFVGTTDGSGWYRNFDHFPWDDPSEHLERSPLMYVGNVTTPTMLMTGERDLRTPISQSEEFYMALQMLEVPTAMIRLTDGWHSRASPPSNFMRVQLYLRNWFERHMTGDMTTDGASNGGP
ncbi:MAG: S9 family peptidase [Gemmatimonadales bacterium]|nr:MAG: S9 family peptidase [Gemmatimonadales bacterium]